MLLLNMNSFGRRVEAKRHNEKNRSGEVHPASPALAQASRPQPGEEVCTPANLQKLIWTSRAFGSQADISPDLNIGMRDV